MTTQDWGVQIASDVERDGLGAELLAADGSIAAEIFRCDADHTIAEDVIASGLSSEVLSWFRDVARRNLGEAFEDGTRIDWSGLA